MYLPNNAEHKSHFVNIGSYAAMIKASHLKIDCLQKFWYDCTIPHTKRSFPVSLLINLTDGIPRTLTTTSILNLFSPPIKYYTLDLSRFCTKVLFSI